MTMRASVNDGPDTGLQLESLRRRNAAAVLRTVRVQGPLARSEIATAIGLSPTAVTKIGADLLRAGYISEVRGATHSGAREPGRPRVPVELDRTRHRFVGVHIGLQRLTVGLVDLGGEVVTLRARLHGAHRPAAVLAKIRRLVREVVDRGTPDGGAATVLGYGVCSGGWVSPEEGVVREFPGLGWHDVALRDGLRVDGLPEPSVDSSVRALALAEARLGAAQGVDNVLYVFVGNVIGCAHVLHGQIARGRQSAAGTIDHLIATGREGMVCTCGRRDCLWAVASDAALIAAASARGLLGAGAHIEDLVDLARQESPQAAEADELLAARARDIGGAVGALLDLFDPEMVVVGGGVRLAVEHLSDLIAAARRRTALPHDGTPVLPAALVGPTSLVRGAAAPVLDAFYDDPLAAVPARLG
jgi:predicted NBD/HSP70 family sugar kinase